MYTKWTQHLKTAEEKQEFERYIRGSYPLLNRLKDIVKDYASTLDRSETDIAVFDTPNWEYRQAFKNGQRSVLENVLKLIDLDLQTKKES